MLVILMVIGDIQTQIHTNINELPYVFDDRAMDGVRWGGVEGEMKDEN